jgi:hypothetical protein
MASGDVLMAQTVAQDDGRYLELARAWVEGALSEALPECAEALRSGQRLNLDANSDVSVPRGEPNALWAGLITRSTPQGRKRVSVFTEKSWDKFLAGLAKEPYRAELEMCALDDKGFPTQAMARVGVEHVQDNPDWLQFEVVATDSLCRWRGVPQLQTDWVSFVRRQAELQKCTFGNIANDNVGERTALEENLLADPAETVPESREVLRGYSWVTICSDEIADRLGGARSLRTSGAFSEVIELSHRGLLLRTTPTFDEYDDAAIGKTFRALAPVLIPGRTEPVQGFEYWNLVYDVDAADFR